MRKHFQRAAFQMKDVAVAHHGNMRQLQRPFRRPGCQELQRKGDRAPENVGRRNHEEKKQHREEKDPHALLPFQEQDPSQEKRNHGEPLEIELRGRGTGELNRQAEQEKPRAARIGSAHRARQPRAPHHDEHDRDDGNEKAVREIAGVGPIEYETGNEARIHRVPSEQDARGAHAPVMDPMTDHHRDTLCGSPAIPGEWRKHSSIGANSKRCRRRFKRPSVRSRFV